MMQEEGYLCGENNWMKVFYEYYNQDLKIELDQRIETGEEVVLLWYFS